MSSHPVLVLGARHAQLPLFEAIRRRGLRIAAIDPDPDAIGLAMADHTLVADLADDATCLAFARSLDVGAVVTFAADYPVPLLARIAATFGLPGISTAAADAATDKLHMRRALADAGISIPRWFHAENLTEARAAMHSIDGPIVVKPRRSSGSRGVTGLDPDDTDALGDAVAEAASFGDRPGVLIEQQIIGPELSIESFAVDGNCTVLARTDKSTTGPPHFVEIGHSQPADLSTVGAAAIDTLVIAATLALGIDNGLAHTEVRVGPDGPVVIEVAARAGGGCIASHLIPLSTGIDAADLALAAALGERPDPLPSSCTAAAVRYVEVEPGQIVAIDGLDRARATPGVELVEFHAAPGDEIDPLRDARHRIGWVVARGANPAAARDTAAAATHVIEVKLR